LPVCLTAERGRSFAGGRPLHTRFGTFYGTNITPDPETGIGRWSEAAFLRALREGLDRDGRHLYPVFPYEYFTRLTDEDVRALYAFIMTASRCAPKTDRMICAFHSTSQSRRRMESGSTSSALRSSRILRASVEWNRGCLSRAQPGPLRRLPYAA
jgi:hypothetical protein